ncbi:MAG TPA: NDP-hexose 4-ketoreductase, partial [Candidatus Latescibacteria bacterium]|nr:NDP-hexose 4-ketoreductase [Candidatus Latescibacterota bacterium]
ESAINRELKRAFNPEFLNRLDEVVIFNTLSHDDMLTIVHILMSDVKKRVKDRHLDLEITPAATVFLAEKGYDPALGARPLKRTIQKYLEDPLSEEILTGKFDGGGTVLIDRDGDRLVFSLKDVLPAPAQNPNEPGIEDHGTADPLVGNTQTR